MKRYFPILAAIALVSRKSDSREDKTDWPTFQEFMSQFLAVNGPLFSNT